MHCEYGRDHLVGFVTARLVYLYECDPMAAQRGGAQHSTAAGRVFAVPSTADREMLGLSAKSLDGQAAVYVLTLGVVPGCRGCGIARSLLGLVHQHAVGMRCRAIFLHVISYNDAAMRLYGGSGYQAMAQLPNFYHLAARAVSGGGDGRRRSQPAGHLTATAIAAAAAASIAAAAG
ncbi:hypothetical protein TSOC_012830 [Tetrabaena socialis]|uniref:N-alpha-acetyltransferase 60 n=1 Tax=Tetrabaena socialis TaxID=47790 RepID=A0A2J7ZM03_9CHLO|nr:hypothetical protein TSOC_012830 [Tetrabaena socialis]|eukprot:PNH01292.1 hypothetical protein TSOC_012830 [Tetrabaena socialis]